MLSPTRTRLSLLSLLALANCTAGMEAPKEPSDPLRRVASDQQELLMVAARRRRKA
jgi:hypothetical protein